MDAVRQRCSSVGRLSSEDMLSSSDLQDSTGRFVHDKLGRIHFKIPHTGYLHVVNCAARYHEATTLTHANDLSSLIQEQRQKGKTGVCLSVDGGPDYTLKSTLTDFAFGRLWRDQNLDYLLVSTHAPGDSCYNRIEHAWAPLSNFLTDVTLPASLPGEEPLSGQ